MIAWMAVSKWLPESFPVRYALHSNFMIVLGTLAIFLVGLVASPFLRRS